MSQKPAIGPGGGLTSEKLVTKPDKKPDMADQAKQLLLEKGKMDKHKKEEAKKDSTPKKDKKKKKKKAGEDDDSSSSDGSIEEVGFMASLKKFLEAIKAMVSRQMFLLHALLCMWRLTKVQTENYWYMAVTLLFLLAETVVVLWNRSGREWDVFQFGVFFYLSSVVPPIWILELTKLGVLEMKNSTDEKVSLSEEDRSDPRNVFNALGHKNWLLGLEQSLLVIIIISRWLIPKGRLTREELSSLLLGHLGTASDIVDFFVVLDDGRKFITTNDKEDGPLDETRYHNFIFLVLILWTASLLQFPIVLTSIDEEEEAAAKSKTKKKGNVDEPQQPMKKTTAFKKLLNETDAWGVVTALFLQDVPFLIARVIIIYHYSVRNKSIFFFTFKNILVVSLQVYRMISLYIEHRKHKEEEKIKKKLEFVTFLKDILQSGHG